MSSIFNDREQISKLYTQSASSFKLRDLKNFLIFYNNQYVTFHGSHGHKVLMHHPNLKKGKYYSDDYRNIKIVYLKDHAGNKYYASCNDRWKFEFYQENMINGIIFLPDPPDYVADVAYPFYNEVCQEPITYLPKRNIPASEYLTIGKKYTAHDYRFMDAWDIFFTNDLGALCKNSLINFKTDFQIRLKKLQALA